MTVLADYRSSILQFLGDTSGDRYSTGILDEALRQALNKYSNAWPQVKEADITVATAGRDQSLSACTGIVAVLDLVYPYVSTNKEHQTFEHAFYQFRKAGVPMISILGSAIPQVSQHFRVRYTVPHTIENLDSAAATTVEHDNVLVIGGSAFSALIRSGLTAEAQGSWASDVGQLEHFAAVVMREFDAMLARLRVANPIYLSLGYPSSALHSTVRALWKLDQWDT